MRPARKHPTRSAGIDRGGTVSGVDVVLPAKLTVIRKQHLLDIGFCASHAEAIIRNAALRNGGYLKIGKFTYVARADALAVLSEFEVTTRESRASRTSNSRHASPESARRCE